MLKTILKGEDLLDQQVNHGEGVTPQCYDCKHRTSALNCTAFPDGIPVAILGGIIDHSFPIPNDRGVVYEPRETVQKSNPYRAANGRYTSKDKAVKVTSFEDDMQAQMRWLSDKAKEKGKETIDQLMLDAPGYIERLSKEWRRYHTFKSFFSRIFKENPYRDERGRYASKDTNSSGTWEAKPHSQLGSNEGGVYYHDGVKKYVKFAKNPDQTEAEVTSARIHEMMGVRTVNPQKVVIGGRKAVASEWIDGIQPLGRDGWRNLNDTQRSQAADAFMAGVLTKNWDVVGLAYDNICKDKQGNLVLVDTGGSFAYRAQGGHKDYNGDISGEVSSFLSKDKTSGRVFAPLLEQHPEVFRKAAARLSNISDQQLIAMVKSSNMKGKNEMAAAIIQRKQRIIEQFS